MFPALVKTTFFEVVTHTMQRTSTVVEHCCTSMQTSCHTMCSYVHCPAEGLTPPPWSPNTQSLHLGIRLGSPFAFPISNPDWPHRLGTWFAMPWHCGKSWWPKNIWSTPWQTAKLISWSSENMSKSIDKPGIQKTGCDNQDGTYLRRLRLL